jgi:cystathionine beta-lyase
VFTRDELERMSEICLRHRVILVSDEIHCDLVFPGHAHLPVASLDPEIAARSLTLIAPSKTYNLAGLQCSVAIIPDPELRSQFLAARHGLVPWVNLLGLVAAQAAYQHGSEWLAQVLDYLRQNRDFLLDYVQQEMPALEMTRPEGTYLAWIDCRKAEIPGSPYRFFLEKALVALNDGAGFGKGGEGFVRLNFGCSRELLEIALGRMSQALRQLVSIQVIG